jgi:hypothetical protein
MPHTSAFTPYARPRTISGAANWGVPTKECASAMRLRAGAAGGGPPELAAAAAVATPPPPPLLLDASSLPGAASSGPLLLPPPQLLPLLDWCLCRLPPDSKQAAHFRRKLPLFCEPDGRPAASPAVSLPPPLSPPLATGPAAGPPPCGAAAAPPPEDEGACPSELSCGVSRTLQQPKSATIASAA